MAFAFVDFEGESFVQVTSLDLTRNEYCPWKLQSAVGRHHSPSDCAADVLAFHPFQPFWLGLAAAKRWGSDSADYSATAVGSDGIEAPDPVLAVVAAFAAALVGDTWDSCPAPDSCSACFDSQECCWHNHSRVRCSAWREPSFDVAEVD